MTPANCDSGVTRAAEASAEFRPGFGRFPSRMPPTAPEPTPAGPCGPGSPWSPFGPWVPEPMNGTTALATIAEAMPGFG